MSNRLLSTLLLVQTLLLTALLAERLFPVAHAQSGPIACQVTNWPNVLTGNGFETIRVKIDGTTSSTPLAVTVKDWENTDTVKVQVVDWANNDTVRAEVVDWNTSDRVRIEQ